MAPKSKKAPRKVKDLASKKLEAKKAGSVKGGRAGPGTQTEDEIYIGRG